MMIFILQRPPVLFTFTDPGEAMRPSVTVFNPLRDRAPEQVAERMLMSYERAISVQQWRACTMMQVLKLSRKSDRTGFAGGSLWTGSTGQRT